MSARGNSDGATAEDRSGAAVAAVLAGAAAAGPRCGTTTVVAVEGPAGSGKTTLAGLVATGLDARTVHMDDLYEGWSGMLAGGERLRDQVLRPIALGRPGRYQRYDWAAGRFAEWHDVPVGGHLVVEGVGSVRPSTLAYLSVVVWVEADEEVRMARGLARDGVELEGRWREWMVTERRMYAAERTREHADVRVDAWGRLLT